MNNIKLVPTYEISNKQELDKYHSKFIAEGYEGTIVRHGSAGYESNKRSSSLLKYKDFLDISCTIKDVQPTEKRPEHGMFICSMPDGKDFGCGMKFSFAEREKFLKEKESYVGLTAEIRFFEYTDEGLPRFPVCVGIRLDK